MSFILRNLNPIQNKCRQQWWFYGEWEREKELVGEYENMCEIEKKNVRCCIDKNESILEKLTYVERLWHQKIKKCSNICVGRDESQTYVVNQSSFQLGMRNVGIENVECMGWWFSDHAASTKGRSQKVRTNLCDVECCRRRGRCSLSRSRIYFQKNTKFFADHEAPMFLWEGDGHARLYFLRSPR